MAKKTFIVDGIKVKVDENVLDDYEVVKLFSKITDETPELGDNPSDEEVEHYNKLMAEKGNSAVKLVSIILKDQEEMVLEKLRKRNKGVAKAEDVFKFISHIIEENNKTKK